MIGDIFIVLEKTEIPDTEAVQTWGRQLIKDSLPGIIEFSDQFPGGLIRFTGPLTVKNKEHAGIKLSCVEPRVYKLLILSLHTAKKTHGIKHIRILEKKTYTNNIHMTFKAGIISELPFKDTLFKETCEAYNLLYAEKINPADLRKNLIITNANTTLEVIDNNTHIKGYLDIQLQPGTIPETTLHEFLHFIEIHGIGIDKDKGYGNIRLFPKDNESILKITSYPKA